MKILVDTSVWSLMLRRKHTSLNSEESGFVRELQDAVNDDRARLIGPIRQELLSGIKMETQFQQVRLKLAVFDDEKLTTDDYERAAIAANQCARAGVATTSIDLLICSVALHRGWPIFTTDKGFRQLQRVLKFQLYAPALN